MLDFFIIQTNDLIKFHILKYGILYFNFINIPSIYIKRVKYIPLHIEVVFGDNKHGLPWNAADEFRQYGMHSN